MSNLATRCDAAVIGSGPNGLVAANALAEAGWQVVVIEEQPEVGGAVRSAEVIEPGFVTDLYSAFYPLAAASSVIQGLELDKHGLRWVQAPTVLAHQLDDGRAAVLHRDPAATAAALDEWAPGDGQSWLEMFAQWQLIRDDLLGALFTPFPPVRPALGLLRRLKVAGALRLARLAATPVRRLGEERFAGDGGRLLLSGNAMHADIPVDAAGSGMFGWLLCMLGQDVGFPVPQGGSGMLSAALRSRAESFGAQVHTGVAVEQVLVEGGRAVGVRLADGSVVSAAKAVLADVTAPALYSQLLADAPLPAQLRHDLRDFQWDHATLKVNWALRAPIPWLAESARGAGTVHLGVDADGFVDFGADLSVGRLPRRPFALFGQMAVADPTRAPEGAETAWAYTHLPRRLAADPESIATQVRRVQDAVERAAPGFGDLVIGRHVQAPSNLEGSNANLSAGALNSGTAAIHQELIFRPTVGLGRPETPIPGLFLASASAHPGGGVHGACGWNAARCALAADGRFASVRNKLISTAWGRVLGDG